MNKSDGTSHDEDDADVGFLNFVPPPPRGLFLDDGVAGCDLCAWAIRDQPAIVSQRKGLTSGEMGWILTLVIVSISSAVIGAALMVVITHCKRRLKSSPGNEIALDTLQQPTPTNPTNKELAPPTTNNQGGWSWWGKRNQTRNNLNNASHVMENHYTHMEGQYNAEEALYDELDKEPTTEGAYQNSAFSICDTTVRPSLRFDHSERIYETVHTDDAHI